MFARLFVNHFGNSTRIRAFVGMVLGGRNLLNPAKDADNPENISLALSKD